MTLKLIHWGQILLRIHRIYPRLTLLNHDDNTFDFLLTNTEVATVLLSDTALVSIDCYPPLNVNFKIHISKHQSATETIDSSRRYNFQKVTISWYMNCWVNIIVLIFLIKIIQMKMLFKQYFKHWKWNSRKHKVFLGICQKYTF